VGGAEQPRRTQPPRMSLQNGGGAGNGAARKGTASRVKVASRHGVSVCPDGSTGPGIYGYLVVHIISANATEACYSTYSSRNATVTGVVPYTSLNAKEASIALYTVNTIRRLYHM
jgi:hypothetical protein